MLAWLRDRFNVLSGAWGVLDGINVTEIREAWSASRRSLNLIGACNWSADDEVGEAIDSVFVAAKESADVTKTQVDDQIVEGVDAVYRPNRTMVIESIQWLIAKADDDLPTGVRLRAFADSRGYAAASEHGSVLIWIQLAAMIWQLIKPFVRR